MAIGSLGTVSYDIIAQDKTGDGIDSASKKTSKLSDVGMKAGLAMTGIGLASSAMADNINESYLSFDFAMAQVKSLGGVTDEQMEVMKDSALALSQTLPISATEIAEGFYQMRSAGYDAEQVISELPTIANMAVAGNMEMSDAVNAVTMVLDVYGDAAGSAQDVTNILMGTVQEFKTTLPELQMELSKNIGVAGGLGISFEELAAMSGMLKKDFVSSEEAGTALKTMLMRLTDPATKEAFDNLGISVADSEGNFVGIQSTLQQLQTAMGGTMGSVEQMGVLSEIFSDLGISINDSEGNFIGLENVLAQMGPPMEDVLVNLYDTGELSETNAIKLKYLTDNLEDLGVTVFDAKGNYVGFDSVMDQLSKTMEESHGNVGQMAMLTEIFGSEGVRAAQSLIRQQKELPKYSKKVSDAGIVQEALTAQLESTSSQLEIAKNKSEDAKIALGESMAPATMLVADATGTLATKLSELPEPLQKAVGLGIIAGESFSILGPIMMGLAAIQTTAVVPALFATAGGVWAVLAPLLPIILAIAAVIGVLYILEKKFGLVSKAIEFFLWTLDEVYYFLEQSWNYAMEHSTEILDALYYLLLIIPNPISAVVFAFRNWDTIKSVVSDVINLVIDKATDVYNFLIKLRDKVGDIVDAFKDWDSIKKTVSDSLGSVMDKINSYYDDMKKAGTEFIQKFIDGFNSVSWDILTKASNMAYEVWKRFEDYVISMYNTGKGFINNFIDGFNSVGWDILIKASDMAYQVWKRFSDYVTNMYNTGKDFIRDFISGFYSVGFDIYIKASDMAYQVWKRFEDYVGFMYDTGKGFINRFIDGFYASGLWDLILKASDMAYQVWKRFEDYVGFMYDTGKGFIGRFIDGFYASDWWGLILKSSDIAYQVWKRFEDYVIYLYDSGRGFMDSFAAGIYAASPGVFDAANSVLDWLRDLWPFSNAKVGPLSDVMDWGGNFVSILADGITKNGNELTNAFGSILPTEINSGGISPMGGGGGGSGVVSVNVDVTIKNESDIDQLERMIGEAISAGIHEKYSFTGA